MIGTIANSIAIILGSMAGLLIKGGIPERVSDTIMKGLALCVFYIGISGAFKGENTIITIVCIAIGALIGELIDIDKRLNSLGKLLENKINKKYSSSKGEEPLITENMENGQRESKKISISQGFVYASLIFCVGAIAIVGSLESGLQGNYETLFTKSILDGVSAIIFTASLGIGVIFSAAAVFLYQGIITMGAGILAGVLSSSVIAAMTAIGSLLIMGLGLNMMGATNIKVANLLPAVFLPIVLGIMGMI